MDVPVDWTKIGVFVAGAGLLAPGTAWGIKKVLLWGTARRRRLREQRDRAAAYLEQISISLEQMAVDFESKGTSPARCAELALAISHIQDVLRTTGIGWATNNNLLHALSHVEEAPGIAFRGAEQEHARRLVWRVAWFLKEGDSPPLTIDVPAEIAKMRAASGLFKGAAAAMRAL